MSWSDILGIVGGVASAVGGFLPGPYGAAAGAIGGLAKDASGIIGASSNAQTAKTASNALAQTTSTGNTIAIQQQKDDQEAFMKAMGLIPQEASSINSALTALGPAYQVDANAVDARAQTLLPEYMFQADQDLTKAASTGVGTLMRSGTDDSTFGIAERMAVGAQGADEHRKMYNQAYQDALDYVTKLGSASDASRNQAITEAKAPYEGAITALDTIYGRGNAASALTPAADAAKANLTDANANVSGITAGSQNDQTTKDLTALYNSIFGTTNPPAGNPGVNDTPSPFQTHSTNY